MSLTPSIIADLLLLGILGLISGHGYYLYRQRRWLLFDPLNLFWGGVLVCYVEQPISHAATFIGWHGEELFCRTLFWVLIGLVCVVVGYEIRWGGVFARKLPKMPEKMWAWRVSVLACVLILLGLASYAYDMHAVGGAQVWLSVGRGGTDIEGSSAYFRELQHFLPVGIIVLLFAAEMSPSNFLHRLVAWSAGILMWMWFVYLGTRSRTIMFGVVLMAAWYLPRRKNPPVLLLAPLFVGLWLLVNFQATYRNQFTNLSFNLHSVDWSEFQGAILPSWLGGAENTAKEEVSGGLEFNCVMTVVKLVPDLIPYNYGYGHLEVFTRPIPRAIWPGKRYPHLEALQGVFREGGLTESTGGFSDLLAGPALTFAGDWYYVWGPLGLILGGLLTGIIFRTIREYYESSRHSLATTLVYLQLLTVGFNEAAATPLYWLITLSPPLLLLWLACNLCRERPIIPAAAYPWK